jgi:hypothetical protein
LTIELVLAGLLGGSLSALLLFGLALRVSRKDTAAARAELAVANERLIQARKEGLLIPTVEDVAPAATPEAPVLTKDLQALIDDWDSPVAREAQRRMIHELLAAGLPPAAVYQRLAPQPV